MLIISLIVWLAADEETKKELPPLIFEKMILVC